MNEERNWETYLIACIKAINNVSKTYVGNQGMQEISAFTRDVINRYEKGEEKCKDE